MARVPADMLGHEGRDEVIGMVVAGMHADVRRHVGGFAGIDQQIGLELFLEEIVRRALVDNQVRMCDPNLDSSTFNFNLIFAWCCSGF